MFAVIRWSMRVSRGRGEGMNGCRGPWSSACCAASRPWLTNGVEERVVLLVIEKEKKKISLFASTEDDTLCSGLCSYQFSSNTPASLNLSVFVPPGCLKKKNKKNIQVLLSSVPCAHGLSKDRFGNSVICKKKTFIASSPGGIGAFRKDLFSWKLQTCHGWCCSTCTAQVWIFFPPKSISNTHVHSHTDLYICVYVDVCRSCMLCCATDCVTSKQSLLLYLTGLEVVFGSSWDHLTKVNLIQNLKKKTTFLFCGLRFWLKVWRYGSFWALGGALRWKHVLKVKQRINKRELF